MNDEGYRNERDSTPFLTDTGVARFRDKALHISIGVMKSSSTESLTIVIQESDEGLEPFAKTMEGFGGTQNPWR